MSGSINFENDLLRTSLRLIETAGGENHAGCGKIQKGAVHQLIATEHDFTPSFRLIDALDNESAGCCDFDNR